MIETSRSKYFSKSLLCAQLVGSLYGQLNLMIIFIAIKRRFMEHLYIAI